MLRWLFLLLLLANAVVLLWAAMMRPDRPVEEVPPPPAGGVELRLLSEVASSALRPKPAAPDFSAAALNLCLAYSGFADRTAANQAVLLMRDNGLAPRLETESESLPDGFDLVLDVPASTAERLALLERLDALGVVPESRPGDGVLRLGRFEDRPGAEGVLAPYADSGLAPELRPRERVAERFTVLIPAATDRNLFNKINRVLEKTNPGIKIEKKVCEGVASPETDQ